MWFPSIVPFFIKPIKIKKQTTMDEIEKTGMNDDVGFEIPEEIKGRIIDIMNDCPDIRNIGDKEYRVHNLRMYSLNRIMKLAMSLFKEDPEKVPDDKRLIFAMCTDMDKGCEIVATILCNHLFKPENVDKDDVDSVYTYNDRLIRYMKAKVINSTLDGNQWASLILGAVASIDLSAVFTTLVLVKQSMASLTKTRTKAEQQLKSWREAKSGI